MRKLLTIAMISLAALAAKADLYLYWSINPGDFGATYAAVETTTGSVVTFAELNGAGWTNANSQMESGFVSGVDYWVALYDSALSRIAVSEQSYTYADISAYTYDKSNVQTPQPSSPLQVAGFAIPEPTSGLMLLLGLGALALKRKVA